MGYATGQEETTPGIFTESYVERKMKGDVLHSSLSRQESSYKYDTITLGNSISLIGDRYSFENFLNIVYITYMGGKWKVTEVQVQPPRLILSIGGIWNGD